jgi:polar amino acid transport system substrate-binding protein
MLYLWQKNSVNKTYQIFFSVFLTALLFGCNSEENSYTNLDQLEGGRLFAVPTGTVADMFVLERFPDAKLVYYNTVLDCALAVDAGLADAAVYDMPVLQNIAAKNPGLSVIDEVLVPDSLGFAVHLNNRELKSTIDQVLEELKSDGTYAEMYARWFPDVGSPAPMPDFRKEDTDGVITFGTAAVSEPLSFFVDHQNIAGFDIEFAWRIANELNKDLEIVNLEFGALLPALIAGRVDMIGAGLSITEERAKSVLFSDSYYIGGLAAIVQTNPETAPSGAEQPLKSVDDISDKRLGVLMGSIYDDYASRNFPEASIHTFNAVPDMLIALKTRRIDATFVDQPMLKEVLSGSSDFAVLEEFLFYIDIAAGFSKQNADLRQAFNEYIQNIKADGTHDEIINRWMKQSGSQMPQIEKFHDGGQLKVGIVSDIGLPYAAMSQDEYIGLDIEIASRFASRMEKELVFVNLPFASLLPSLVSGRIDFITAAMTITEERAKQIDFSEPYVASGASILIRHHESIADTSSQRTFISNIGERFYDNMIREKRYLLILNGLYVTILITLLSAFTGTLLGALICLMRMSKNNSLQVIARFFISIIRGTPVLVLLMIIYYIVFASLNISAVLVAIIAFGINFAAYVSEMFRTSIESVDSGQSEAGIASGFTRFHTFYYIIMPQALRRVIPVYKGEFISLLKMTSIVGYIAVQDLTKAGDIIRSRTFDAFFPLIMAAVIYLALAWSLTLVLDYIEISVDPKKKRLKIRRANIQ